MKDNATTGRSRVTISDGLSRLMVMVSTQCNALIVDGTIAKGTIVKVSGMLNQNVSAKR